MSPMGTYGLIYETIWDSSVAERWEAVIALMVLCTMADKDDNVFSDVDRLSRKTNIPASILRPGLEFLLKPDPNSRSRSAGGRRIVFLPLVEVIQKPSLDGPCRGWHIVNRRFYMRLLRKKYNTAYVSRKRAQKRGEAEASGVTSEDRNTAIDEAFKK